MVEDKIKGFVKQRAYNSLYEMAKDEGLSIELRDTAKKHAEEIILKKIQDAFEDPRICLHVLYGGGFASAQFVSLMEIIKSENVSLELKEMAGLKIVEKKVVLEKPYHSVGVIKERSNEELFYITTNATDVSFPEKVREAAGLKLIERLIASGHFETIEWLIKQDIPEKVKEKAKEETLKKKQQSNDLEELKAKHKEATKRGPLKRAPGRKPRKKLKR